MQCFVILHDNLFHRLKKAHRKEGAIKNHTACKFHVLSNGLGYYKKIHLWNRF